MFILPFGKFLKNYWGFCSGIIVLNEQKVDLVDLSSLKIFMYTDDLAYTNIDPSKRNHTVNNFLNNNIRSEFTPPDMQTINGDNVIYHIIKHHWENNLEFTFIDVGCQYGTSALTIGQFIKFFGKNNKVIAFEPGRASKLVDYNIRLNKLNDIVKHELYAVSNHDYPTILFTELAHSENNRIINRDFSSENISYVVDCISIDEYLSKNNINNNLILKIDTQGAEYEVVQGMKNALQQRYVTYIIEFTPWALSIDAVEFLYIVGNNSYIFDIGYYGKAQNKGLTPIESFNYKEFVNQVNDSLSKWTDLLVIPKKLPNIGKIIG